MVLKREKRRTVSLGASFPIGASCLELFGSDASSSCALLPFLPDGGSVEHQYFLFMFEKGTRAHCLAEVQCLKLNIDVFRSVSNAPSIRFLSVGKRRPSSKSHPLIYTGCSSRILHRAFVISSLLYRPPLHGMEWQYLSDARFHSM